MFNQKGFSKVAIIVIVLILIGGGYFVFSSKVKNVSPQNTENQNDQLNQFSSADLSITASFKESGSVIKNNSVWNFTVRKYNSKNDSWSEEGPFKLKLTNDSMCQSTRIKSMKCVDFSLSNNYYNAIEVEGIKENDEILVLNLTIIQ